MLALVLVVLGGFCLGVERGKSLDPQPILVATAGIASAGENSPVSDGARIEAAVHQPRGIPSAAETVPPRSQPQRKVLPVIPAVAPTAPSATAPATAVSPEEEFAIQLATYVGQESAQQEVNNLAKMGVRAQVLKQGKYLELRAVGYRSKAEAKEALALLRKKYPDAFLKRVAH